MLIPTLFLLGLGLVAAIGLSIASKVFYVYEDPKIEEVENSLLGANCGGCGYAGCSAAAKAVVEGKEGPEICVAGGPDIALAVAEVMGMEVEIKEAEIALLSCTYNIEDAEVKYNYKGFNDCRAAMLYSGGSKECPIGCLGLGTCVKSCPFGALSLNNGLPLIDPTKCRGCGVCVEICPKNIIKLSSTSLRMIGDYTEDECTTPCQRTCPTGIDIPSYIKLISEGKYNDAIKKIREKNPLPLICGRICPAPCEVECRRNLLDQPVAINNLKRFVADIEMENGVWQHPYKGPEKETKIAIIGGGTEGLTTSYYLASLGYQPTIFESMPKLGGIIRNVIAKNRLPEDVLDWEIKGILDIGVKAETGKTMGKDISIGSLFKEGFDVVMFATGGIDSRKIMRGNVDIDESLPGVHLLLDFIVDSKKENKIDIGNDVYIVGGGNSTIQAAMICKEKGSKNINIIYPNSREDIISRGIDIQSADENGIKFHFNTVVNSLSGEEDKILELSLKKNGDQIITVTFDSLIVASGRLSELIFVKPIEEDESDDNNKDVKQITNKWHTLETFKVFPNLADDDIFNLGENALVNDNVAVVKSIGRGRRLARTVHLYLSNKDLETQKNVITNESNIINIDHIDNVETSIRQPMPMNPESINYSEIDRFYNVNEINIGYSEEIALEESKRCLQCGLICYAKTGNTTNANE